MRPGDLYNFAPANYLQTPLTRYSTGLFLNYDLTENVELYSELAFTRNKSSRTLAPIPTGAFYVTNLDNPLFSESLRQVAAEQFVPVAPGLVGFALRRRWEELGTRQIEQQRDYTRAVVGVRGAINDTWDFNAWVSYADVDESEQFFNGASASRIDQALLVNVATGQCVDTSGGCVPLNIFAPGAVSDEAADFVRLADIENVTQREQTLVSTFVTGSPLSNWAGPVDVALGIEWRTDSIAFKADDNLFSGDALGYLGDASISGEESVLEVYGEAVVPLLRSLPGVQSFNLELGARYSDYRNAGTVDTCKVGAEWALTNSLRLRSALQHSVRAPNLQEAFQERIVTEGNLAASDTSRDLCSASANPQANGNVERCRLQGIPSDQIGIFEATPFSRVNFISGGNPDLTPEQADTFTVGIVFQPGALPGFDAAIDYFDLEVTDTIGSIDATEVCFDPGNISNAFCTNIRRDPQTLDVVEVFEPRSNRGISAVRGIDTQLNYATTLPSAFAFGDNAANLNVSAIWTHTLRNIVQDTPVSTRFNCDGVFGEPCGGLGGGTIPEVRVTTNVRYASGPLDVNLTSRWIGGTENGLPQLFGAFGIQDATLAIPNIDATHYVDLRIGFTLSENVSVRLNIANLTDENPPLLADAVDTNNTDTRLFDVFGRSYQLAFSLRL